MKKIKELEAKKICETYDYDFAIIIGVRASDGAGGIATYGMTKELCKKAETYKYTIASTIFGPEVTNPDEIKTICSGDSDPKECLEETKKINRTARFSEVPKVKTQAVFQEVVR